VSIKKTLPLVAAAAALAALPTTATAHRSGCHGHHTCPSDHATYRWNGQLCISHVSGDYRPGFNKRITYQGRTYYCHR
jgi:hypothetical protein